MRSNPCIIKNVRYSQPDIFILTHHIISLILEENVV